MSSYDPDNIFARILRDEVFADRVYEDDYFVAFRDVAPAASTHVLVIPRALQVTGPAALQAVDAPLIGRMVVVATQVARELGLEQGGYRLVMNQGRDAGQSVHHLHLHIIGGGELGPVG